jgi:tRNA-specific 2-thiouridylase
MALMQDKKKVIVAMSGGVDSSVAAALLKKQGFEVTGFHFRLFKDGKKEKQLKKAAKAIGIRLVVRDARKEFEKKVIGYFLREYKAGRTPNPCVVCNKCIKFKFLFDKLLELEADYVATGHYVRLRREILNSKSEIPNLKNLYKLCEAKDKTKDQSYFLYTLDQKQLAKILFPLGGFTKNEVKKLAKKFGLPVLDQEESRGACFIAEKWPDVFLESRIKMKKGDIIDAAGNKLGKHIGLALYTIGQRRNIRIGGTGPYYVLAKDLKKNRLIVTGDPKDPRLFSRTVALEKVSWVAGEPRFPLRTRVKIRYQHQSVSAIIKTCSMKHATYNNAYKVKFDKPQRAVTPGQSAVFYGKGGEVLGGGIIC